MTEIGATSRLKPTLVESWIDLDKGPGWKFHHCSLRLPVQHKNNAARTIRVAATTAICTRATVALLDDVHDKARKSRKCRTGALP